MPSSKRKLMGISQDENHSVGAVTKKSSLFSYFTPKVAGVRKQASRTFRNDRKRKSKSLDIDIKKGDLKEVSSPLIGFDTSTPTTPSVDRSFLSRCDTNTLSSSTPPSVSSQQRSSGKSSSLLSKEGSRTLASSKTINKIESSQGSTNRRKKASQQVYLDFGQASFGKRIICKVCGHLYVNGQAEDEAIHRTVCSHYQFGIPFHGWKNERIALDINRDDRIVEIRPNDSKQKLNKLEQVKNIADTDMGFAPRGKSILQPGEHAFLYIRKKRIVAFAIIQKIDHAYILQKNNVRNNQICDATMGVYQIWVHRQHRRTGLASSLINTARRKILYGIVISPNMIAFSSPTESGTAFAKKYTETTNPKVYDC